MESPELISGLTVIDWVLVALYPVGMLAIGWYYSRRSKSTEDYFVGDRRMSPLLVGISLFATSISTISYLSLPGEVLGKGPIYLTRILAYPVAFLIIGFVLLPVYMKQQVTSAYELLEKKLGLSIRLLGASLFVIERIVWMALMVHLTGKAVTVMIGISPMWTPALAFLIGLVAVIYTSMGGLRAVVVIDFIQALLMFGGAALVLGLVTYQMRGVAWFPTTWESHWDRQPIVSTDPSVRVTVLGTFLSTLLYMVCIAGGDQTSVQRYMATTDAKAARRASAIQLIVTTLVTLLLSLVGLALLAYFRTNPAELPQQYSISNHADDLFPWFIAHRLPPGASGLMVAALFAAAMAIDSGVNSITAVVMTDGFDRFGFRPRTEKGHLRASRLLALMIGVLVVLASSQIGRVPGNITAMTTKTTNLLAPTIFGLFFFALFIPFSRPAGVWAGAVTGTTAAILTAFSGPIFGFDVKTGNDPISFQWILPISLATNLVVGCLVSWCLSLGNPTRDSPLTEAPLKGANQRK